MRHRSFNCSYVDLFISQQIGYFIKIEFYKNYLWFNGTEDADDPSVNRMTLALVYYFQTIAMENLSSFLFSVTTHLSLQSFTKTAHKVELRKGIYNFLYFRQSLYSRYH